METNSCPRRVRSSTVRRTTLEMTANGRWRPIRTSISARRRVFLDSRTRSSDPWWFTCFLANGATWNGFLGYTNPLCNRAIVPYRNFHICPANSWFVWNESIHNAKICYTANFQTGVAIERGCLKSMTGEGGCTGALITRQSKQAAWPHTCFNALATAFSVWSQLHTSEANSVTAEQRILQSDRIARSALKTRPVTSCDLMACKESQMGITRKTNKLSALARFLTSSQFEEDVALSVVQKKKYARMELLKNLQ